MREETRTLLLKQAKAFEAEAASYQAQADGMLERAAELDAQATKSRQVAEALRADAEVRPIETLTVSLDASEVNRVLDQAIAEAERMLSSAEQMRSEDRPVTVRASRRGLHAHCAGRCIGKVVGQDDTRVHIAVPHRLTQTDGPSS